MCGRFGLAAPGQALLQLFDLPEVPDLAPRYNVAPTQPVAAVRVAATTGRRELAMLYWGLVPSWAKDPEIGARLINARSETAAVKPAFRYAYRRQRCLVPASGFYEWQKVEGGKQPYWVHPGDGGLFAFAGLWERWKDPEGGVLESCTLLTTEPNDLMRLLHNRMPVILHAADYALWLDPEVQEPARLQPLLRPYPSTEMRAYPVSRRVNWTENDDPRCIEPLPHGEGLVLPGLG